MTKLIDALIGSEIPDKLWHYTSFAGLLGIVTSGEIFATDIRFLNDHEEFTHARTILEELAEEMPALGTDKSVLKKTFRGMIKSIFDKGPLHSKTLQVFVSSFSESRDQLSQWRGYSHGSSGVSLGLDLRKIRGLRGFDGVVSFAPCVYEYSQKKALLREAAEDYMNSIELAARAGWDAAGKYGGPFNYDLVLADKPENAAIPEALDKSLRQMVYRLLKIAALLKNASFNEEHEWRLVLCSLAGWGAKPTPRLFRPAPTTLIPYVVYPLGDQAMRLPLTELVLGPGSNARAAEAIDSFLLAKEIKTKVSKSCVPYRPW